LSKPQGRANRAQNHAGNGPAILTQFNEIADKSKKFHEPRAKSMAHGVKNKKPPIMVLP
jgi:hypothetical protein